MRQTTSSEYMVTQFFKKKKPPKIFYVSQRSLERLFPGFTWPHPTPANQVFGTKEHRMFPAQHTWEPLFAAIPRILDMFQGATTAGVLPEKLLLARLDTLIETAILEALENSENPTARLHLQKAAQAADDSWQQTIQGHTGPTIASPTVPEIEQSGLESQHDDDGLGTHICSTRKKPSQRTTAPSATLPAV